MANVKISALPVISTIADNSIFPVVDNGSTQQATALRVKSYMLNGGTVTGQLTFNQAGDAGSNKGQIYLSGATSNRIDFSPIGLGSPALNARSVGTKIVLYAGVDGLGADYGLGVESTALWFSTYDADTSFKWYAGNVKVAELSGTSVLSATTFSGVHNGTVGTGTGATPSAGAFTTVTANTSLLVTGAGGIGYATGAGGTVTQGSAAKNLAVTLNKPTGQIVMSPEILNNAAIVSFTLNNTTISATDMLVVTHRSVGTIGGYTVTATSANNSATIYVRNNTANALAEALVLQFAVIKSVTA
jgi:hypothetical protein